MKKTLTTLALLTLAFVANSQQMLNSKDPITGKTTRVALVNIGAQQGVDGQKFGFSEKDGKKYITFAWIISGVSGEAIKGYEIEKITLILKTDNDSLFRFKPDKEFSRININAYMSSLAVTSEIDDSTLKFFTQHSINIIRIAFNGDEGYDPVYNKKAIEQIKTAAAYIVGK